MRQPAPIFPPSHPTGDARPWVGHASDTRVEDDVSDFVGYYDIEEDVEDDEEEEVPSHYVFRERPRQDQ